MKTLLAPCDPASIERAAKLIQTGALVAFPTETVYGLGANGLDGEAVHRIFEAKGRPADNPLILHVSHLNDILPLIDGPLPDDARKLADAFWPGPLTMVLPRSHRVPDAVTAGLHTVAVRMPSHPAALKLIEMAGVPVAAPSANRSGRPSPTRAEHVLEDMDGRIDMVLDGGPCRVGLESTVVDMTGELPRVLRPGGVTPEMIERALGAVKVDESAMRPLKEGETARSPGMKYRHYAPNGRLTIVRGGKDQVARAIAEMYDEASGRGEKCAILASNADRYGARRTRALGETPEAAAAALFQALREMDGEGIQRIFAEAVDTAGVGLAVMNRLGRAAAFDILDVGR
jgi:L-threonylcarbamoyladenylate synthase